jgi:hypothetical protein
MGYPFQGSLSWSFAYSSAIALLCIAPLTLIEPWLRSSGYLVLIAMGCGILAWGLGLLGGIFVFELHHGLSGAIEELVHALKRLKHDARPWVLVVGPGAGIGIAVAWRQQTTPMATRFLLGLGILFGVGAVLLGATAAGVQTPGWFNRLLVICLTLPVAQISCVVLLLADGISMGVPEAAHRVDAGPLPDTPIIDRLLSRTHINPRADLVVLGVGIFGGVYEYGWLIGIPLGLLFWFVMKVNFSLVAVLWPRRLEGRGLVDRAADCCRLRRHGRPAGDQINTTATADLVALLVRSGRFEEAEVEMETLQPQIDQLNKPSLHNLGAAWITAGRPAVGLALLDGVKGKIPGAMQTLWAISRSAGLLGCCEAEQAKEVLDALEPPRRKQVAMILYNNQAVARLQLGIEPARALELARAAHEIQSIYLTRCTLGAALVASGSNDEAIELLSPLVDEPEAGMAEQYLAFPRYWLGCALQASDRSRSESLLRQAAELGGPWGMRAEETLNSPGSALDADPD